MFQFEKRNYLGNSFSYLHLLTSVQVCENIFCLRMKIYFRILIEMQVMVLTMLQLILDYLVALMTQLGTKVLAFLLLMIPSKIYACS